jgi:hypothetical protein
MGALAAGNGRLVGTFHGRSTKNKRKTEDPDRSKCTEVDVNIGVNTFARALFPVENAPVNSGDDTLKAKLLR